jgi:hypothetical protein
MLAPAVLGALATVALCGAPAAQASKLKEEFAPFVDCPTATAAVCTVGKTSSGEFVMGSKTVPITKTITLQGGLPLGQLDTVSLIPAKDGNTLSKTPLELPGGLLGIANIGGEVTATAEIAGPVSGVQINQFELLAEQGTAVVLPLKVKLDNPLLGDSCYIGSDADPVVLHLTTGTTSPPFPGKPIKGTRGAVSLHGGKRITVIEGNTLVDNTFSVPAATGCGTGLLAPVINGLVNLDAGLPAGAGRNTAIMTGSFIETSAANAEKYAKPPKEKKKK